ncbi:ankyrin repeat-containing domain protein [Aspergillus germanicus]
MLRSILFDILAQDEFFFYHQFQINYRQYKALAARNGVVPMDWPYELLKDTLASLQTYAHSSRYYLIIDAIDESDEDDRRDILNFLFDICANTKQCTVKAVVASRPVGQLEIRRSQFHGFIRLQDETQNDILNFARSFLRGLNLTVLLDKAVTYIIDNAHGVFIWVQLVGNELVACAEEGSSEEEIFEFLESLPLELDAFYTLMLNKMMERRKLEQTLEIFQFVLFARRPLTVSELLHALANPKDTNMTFEPSLERLRRRIPTEQRLVHSGGNFLEIRQHQGIGTIQVIHQTVREFFLRPDGCVATSAWRMVDEAAHRTITIASIRYLLVLITEGSLDHPSNWSSTQFEQYVRHLDGMPFAAYILLNLDHHLNYCFAHPGIAILGSTFIDRLLKTPSYHLLHHWVRQGLQYDVKIEHHLNPVFEPFRDMALIVAARQGHLTAADVIISAGANLNCALHPDKRTPLSWAAGNGNISMVALLLSRGARHSQETSHKDARLPLSWAASNGHQEVVQMLLEAGVDPTAQETISGRTALSWAVGAGQEEVVSLLLLDEGSDLSAEGKYDRDRTLLSRAAERGHKGIIKLLLEHGAAVDGKDVLTDRTPLAWAAAKGHKAAIQLLLDKGAAVESVTKYSGRTPLLWAVEAGRKSAAKLLLDRGADIEAEDTHTCRTPLAWAAAEGHGRVTKLLLRRGADMESHDSLFGRTPLLWAAVDGQENTARILLDHGADMEFADNRSGRTALSWAVEKGHEDVVELLLDRGANTEAKDNYDGRTPLSLAAEHGHEAVVRLLLRKGADVGARDDCDDARTPLSWATRNRHVGVVKLLKGWDTSDASESE